MQPGLFDLELDKILNDSGNLSATRASNLAGSPAIAELCDSWKRRIDGDPTSTNTAVEALKKAWIEAGNDETHLLLLAILGKHGCTTALNIFLNDQSKSKDAVSDRVVKAIIQYFMDPDVAARWKPEAEALFGKMLDALENRRAKILFEPSGAPDSGEDNVADRLDIFLLADVPENMEALRDSLVKLSTTEVRVRVAADVGGITELDADLAIASSRALIIGFNVRANDAARSVIEANGLDLRYYSVIDELIDDVKTAISGPLLPEMREEIIGLAEVRDFFRSPKLGAIAGCMVMEGVLKRNNPIRVLRDNVVVFEGALESLRRFKDDVPEVKAGAECGLSIKGYNDVQVGDQIEGFERIDFDTTG